MKAVLALREYWTRWVLTPSLSYSVILNQRTQESPPVQTSQLIVPSELENCKHH